MKTAIKKTRIICLVIFSIVTIGFHHVQASDFIQDFNASKEELFEKIPITLFDIRYTNTILDWQQDVTEKPLDMLLWAKEGKIKANDFIFSTAFWGSLMFEQSNVAGKFPILSRFPSQHDNTSKKAEEQVINNFALGLSLRVLDWLTVYAQREFTEIEFIGQEAWQWRKGYVMLGNLEKFPFYAYYGRNTVDFGWLDAYNPFTHSVPNHFYRIDSDDPVIGLGFYKEGLHMIGTLIPSGRHLRTADTEDDNGWDNGSFLASYEKSISDDFSFKLGTGYLHSTIYNRDIAHHPGFNLSASKIIKRNGAWDAFLEFHWKQLRLGGEFISTLRKWPTTKHRVQALNVQIAYDLEIFTIPTSLSVVYGRGEQGPSRSAYEKLEQIVAGIEIRPIENIAIAFEYVRNNDFVPLAVITLASDKEVSTNTFIAGIKISF
ncbi:MAG: LbtU family siderophore porin [Promethearchaeota archaeon]|nr:LbtU family siderophore porin [Deltaproteobacteria bacterium]